MLPYSRERAMSKMQATMIAGAVAACAAAIYLVLLQPGPRNSARFLEPINKQTTKDAGK